MRDHHHAVAPRAADLALLLQVASKHAALSCSIQCKTANSDWYGGITLVHPCSNGTETKLVRLLNRKSKGLHPALLPQPNPSAEWRRLDAEAGRGRRRQAIACIFKSALGCCLNSRHVRSVS